MSISPRSKAVDLLQNVPHPAHKFKSADCRKIQEEKTHISLFFPFYLPSMQKSEESV